jgi:outer membrane protein assembly factor BamE (lipoprotein component of BamABCDE complex)
MKNKFLPGAALAIVLLLSSCAVYVAPPFTNIMKISQVKPGMKFKQVVDILGVEPFDIYHVQETGAMLTTFNYRLKKRIMKVNTLNRDEFVRQTTNEDSQTAGDLYYDKDYKVAHVLFSKDGEVTSFITSDGVENSNLIVITGNTIQYADEKNVNLLDPAFNGQVINTKRKEKENKRARRGIFSRFFGVRYQKENKH